MATRLALVLALVACHNAEPDRAATFTVSARRAPGALTLTFGTHAATDSNELTLAIMVSGATPPAPLLPSSAPALSRAVYGDLLVADGVALTRSQGSPCAGAAPWVGGVTVLPPGGPVIAIAGFGEPCRALDVTEVVVP
ncbi:MAG TPA: hypothetical protein VLX92_11085 [Kofleriaceae bacterium]|nr:hypothetical protein [Kofleriaceae bacterium]